MKIAKNHKCGQIVLPNDFLFSDSNDIVSTITAAPEEILVHSQTFKSSELKNCIFRADVAYTSTGSGSTGLIMKINGTDFISVSANPVVSNGCLQSVFVANSTHIKAHQFNGQSYNLGNSTPIISLAVDFGADVAFDLYATGDTNGNTITVKKLGMERLRQ